MNSKRPMIRELSFEAPKKSKLKHGKQGAKSAVFIRTIESLTHEEWIFWSGFVVGVVAMSHETMHALLYGPERAALAVMEHAFEHFMRTGSVRADDMAFDATVMPWDEMRDVLESVVRVIQETEDEGPDEHSEQC